VYAWIELATLAAALADGHQRRHRAAVPLDHHWLAIFNELR
jgi:hypothetical protein